MQETKEQQRHSSTHRQAVYIGYWHADNQTYFLQRVIQPMEAVEFKQDVQTRGKKSEMDIFRMQNQEDQEVRWMPFRLIRYLIIAALRLALSQNMRTSQFRRLDCPSVCSQLRSPNAAAKSAQENQKISIARLGLHGNVVLFVDWAISSNGSNFSQLGSWLCCRSTVRWARTR